MTARPHARHRLADQRYASARGGRQPHARRDDVRDVSLGARARAARPPLARRRDPRDGRHRAGRKPRRATSGFAQRSSRSACRCYSIPGNHDDPKLMGEILTSGSFQLGGELRRGPWSMVLLSTFLAGEDAGGLGPARLQGLRQALAAHAGQHVLVAMHHHPLPMGSTWLDGVALRDAAGVLAGHRRTPERARRRLRPRASSLRPDAQQRAVLEHAVDLRAVPAGQRVFRARRAAARHALARAPCRRPHRNRSRVGPRRRTRHERVEPWLAAALCSPLPAGDGGGRSRGVANRGQQRRRGHAARLDARAARRATIRFRPSIDDAHRARRPDRDGARPRRLDAGRAAARDPRDGDAAARAPCSRRRRRRASIALVEQTRGRARHRPRAARALRAVAPRDHAARPGHAQARLRGASAASSSTCSASASATARRSSGSSRSRFRSGSSTRCRRRAASDARADAGGARRSRDRHEPRWSRLGATGELED